MSLSAVLDVGAGALDAQSKRMSTIASNLANVDSATSSTGAPYKGHHVVFAAIPADRQRPYVTGVRVTAIVEDQSPPRLKYDPGNPFADDRGYVTMPNVNPVEEMADMISASRSYQTNVEVMNTAKQLIQKTLLLGQS